VSLLQSEETKVTLFDDVSSDTGVKEHGQGKGERGHSREVRTYGGRQREATTGSATAASSAPGKNKLLRRYIHKQNLKDSI